MSGYDASFSPDLLPELESWFSCVDWQGLRESWLAGWEAFDVAALLSWLLACVAALFLLLLKLFVLATPVSFTLALSAFLVCWFLARGRADARKPALLSYGARNACNAFLLFLFGNAVGAVAASSLFVSVLVGGGHPAPQVLAVNLVGLLLTPLLFLAFAFFGMRFSWKRSLLALCLFTILFAALVYAEAQLCGQLPLIG